MLQKVFYKVKWALQTRSFRKIGKNTTIGILFSIKGGQFLSVGDEFHAGKLITIEIWDSYKGKKFENTPEIIIGNNVSMMDGCQLSAANHIKIGDGCLFGSNVFITDNFHGSNIMPQLMIPPSERDLQVRGAVNIGANVWIGRNVCIMPGVSIGEGSVVGSNAVVTHDIPAYCVAVGVPAKVLKQVNKNEHS